MNMKYLSTIEDVEVVAYQDRPGVILHLTLQHHAPDEQGRLTPTEHEDIRVLLSPDLAHEIGGDLAMVARVARTLDE